MKVLVTGAAGFTGTRMMEFLAALGSITVTGLIRRPLPEGVRTPGSYTIADLLDRDSLSAAINKISPDAVIHLAGLTRGTPEALRAANVTGTKNLLDAASTANPDCRILVISSSAVYGYAGDSPLAEGTPLQPLSEYGISKKAQEELSLGFCKTGEGAVAIARPFNLAGPNQPDSFVCGRIVKQVVEIERNERNAIEIFEVISSRDLIDVRDVVRGYWALVSHPNFDGDCSGQVFNLGSGNSYPVSGIIALIEEITNEHYPIQLPEIPPPVLIPSQKSDNTRITALTGWKPEIPLKKTLQDMLDTARKK